MFNNLVALALLVCGVGAISFSNQLGFESNPLFLLKFGGAAMAGAGYFIYNYSSYALSLLSFRPKAPSKIFKPEDYELTDFSAITHLRDRCVQAGSDEGTQVCAKLAAIMFQLDTPKNG